MSSAPNGVNQVIVLNTRQYLGLDSTMKSNPPYEVIQLLVNYLSSPGASQIDSIQVSPDAASPAAKAGCTVALSSGSGTVGVYISGVAGTVTWATSDQASATALVAAINALTDAKVQGIVQAGRASFAQVTCASVAAGDTVTLSNVVLTAVAGTAGFAQFSKDTSDTATAASLVLAINGHPILGNYYHAVSSSGVVKIYPTYPDASAPAGLGTEVLTSSNGTTLAVVAQTADPSFAITAMRPGAAGNSISIIATGTGASIGNTVSPTQAFASGNKLLGGGLGNNATQANLYYGRY
jgi:hypothetical protein